MKKFVVIKNTKVSPNNQDTHNQFTTQVKMSGYLKKKRNVSSHMGIILKNIKVLSISCSLH